MTCENSSNDPPILEPEGDFAVVARSGSGQCAFLTEGKSCRIHTEFGDSCLPEICNNFPMYGAGTPDGIEVLVDVVCPAARECLMQATTPFQVVKELRPPAGRRFNLRVGSALNCIRRIPLRTATFIEWDEYTHLRDAMIAMVMNTQRPFMFRMGVIHSMLSEIRTVEEFRARREGIGAFLNALTRTPELLESLAPLPGETLSPFQKQSCYAGYFMRAATAGSTESIFNDWNSFRVFAERTVERLFGKNVPRTLFENWQNNLLNNVLSDEQAYAPFFERYLLVKLASIGLDAGRSMTMNLDYLGTALSQALRYAAAFSAVLQSSVTPELIRTALGFAEYRLRSNPHRIVSLT